MANCEIKKCYYMLVIVLFIAMFSLVDADLQCRHKYDGNDIYSYYIDVESGEYSTTKYGLWDNYCPPIATNITVRDDYQGKINVTADPVIGNLEPDIVKININFYSWPLSLFIGLFIVLGASYFLVRVFDNRGDYK